MTVDASATAYPAAIRNIALLSAAQAVAGSASAIVMAVGALTAASIAPHPSLATLPITAMVIGLALASGPATLVIHRLGRREGLLLGAAVTVPAALLAAWAVTSASFWMFCAALALVGVSGAFGQQYRFAAADSVPAVLRSRAISFVLAGGVFAGFLGPGLAGLSHDWIAGAPFAGTYLVLAAMALAGMAILSFTRLAPATPKAAAAGGRSVRQLLSAPELAVPMLGATASYSLMTLVMVAAPLAMVVVCGHSTAEAAGAIQWHIVAMFAPSFVTGAIITRIGAHLTSAIGLLLIAAAAVTALTGISVAHFTVGLVLLGVGWNFGFIGSTSLLTAGYRPEEAARVQALNEQLVFGTMALASIGSGVLLQLLSWEAINLLAIPVALLAVGAIAWGARRNAARA